MILPERVFGSSAEKMTSSGRASAPIFFATWLFSSSMSPVVASSGGADSPDVNQNRPTIRPRSSRSIVSAAGVRGRPGMVSTSPV